MSSPLPSPWIFTPGSPPTQDLGGKAGTLALLHGRGVPIPDWFVLRPAAFQASFGATGATGAAAATLPPHLDQVGLNPEARAALAQAIAVLCPGGEPVAVRSSAADEDGTDHSFAGQLESFLFVPPSEVAKRAVEIGRSCFSERHLAYRRARQLTPSPAAPAVLVQRMVVPDVAGVAFSADPASGRRGVAVVCASYGLGSGLVAGETNADTWKVDRNGTIIERLIVPKPTARRRDASGERVVTVPVLEPQAERPSLNDDQVRAVADLARELSRLLEAPQDIEFAWAHGRLHLLQSRPITGIRERVDPDGRLNIWDNSNIIESYSGVTTPLTFSFARRAYEGVYRQFCRMMGVPSAVIEAHEATFARMLGLIRGRVYYNLLSWYRLLATLPGFKLNRGFMEQMMGVREGVPDELLAEQRGARWQERLLDLGHLILSLGGLAFNHLLLRRRIRLFHERLEKALAPPDPPLHLMRAEELTSYFLSLESQLLRRWDAPLVNDFFAMIHFGLLRQLSRQWCQDSDGSLANQLLAHTGGLISAEPAKLLLQLADLARSNPAFRESLGHAPLQELEQAMEQIPGFVDRYQHYLERFGERCFDELKLEAPTLRDEPLLLFRAVGRLALNPSRPSTLDTPEHHREDAEARARQCLEGQSLRHTLFFFVLNQARERLRHRENLRFERTRLFGRIRQLFLQLGQRFHNLGGLREARDVFYLEIDELIRFVEGTATTTHLDELVVIRKAEFARYSGEAPPPDRFQTRGPVHHGSQLRQQTSVPRPSSPDTRQGIGCCPGQRTGVVHVVLDPRQAQVRPGEIVVAPRTDPGWILIFTAASGLLLERGSLLSHSAIVARELGIPTIVALDGITGWLQDGDQVEMDGATGWVRKLPVPKPDR